MEQFAQHILSYVQISDAHLALVTQHLVKKDIAKKDHILKLDEFANEVFFILSGCVRTYILDYNGVEHNISFSVEDWWFGDLQSFIQKKSASYNIQALENTTVLAIDQQSWEHLLLEVPAFVAYTRILFRNTMFAHERRILRELSLTGADRYGHFLKEYPSLSQRISQKHIASYLGITPEFLSMLRRKKK